MRQGRRFWLVALGATLALSTLGFAAGRGLRVEEVAPPKRGTTAATLAAAPSGAQLHSLTEPVRSLDRPRVVLPGGPEAIEGMVTELKEACELLKAQRMTAQELAQHFGTVIDPGPPAFPDDPPPMGIEFVPRNPYFKQGFVAFDQDKWGRPLAMPTSLDVTLTDPRHLPSSALVKAFGKPYETLGNLTAPGLGFDWKKQPKGKLRCVVSAGQNWGKNYGLKENVISDVLVAWDDGWEP